jgi:predicted esterase
VTQAPRRPSSSPPPHPTTTRNGPRRVQFVHGLESGPGAAKAVYLARFFETETPAMDTTNFEGSVATQIARLADVAPDVLVGSSFGGAVALAMLQRGAFEGPTLLLAPAHRHCRIEERIPEDRSVLIVHGRADDVVSIDGSRALAKTGTRGRVELVEVDDGHRLGVLLEGDRLAELVRRVFGC